LSSFNLFKIIDALVIGWGEKAEQQN